MAEQKIRKFPKLIELPKQVLRGDGFVKGIVRYATSDAGKRMSAILNEPRHTLKEANTEGATYRLVNFWEQTGLLEDPRPDGKGWRRYSTMDFAWLYIITELRLFGFSLDLIMKVKESLAEQFVYKKSDDSMIPFLEYYVALAFHKMPTYLLVFRDGTAEPTDYARYHASLKFISLANHIQLSLNAFVQRLYPHIDLEPKFDRTVDVTDEELEVLFLLRTGNYESVTVKRRNGKIERIEAEESLSVDKKIEDILKEQDFQEITIKKHKGKVVRITRSLKQGLREN